MPVDLEKKLSTAILMMIAGNLDRWQPQSDNNTVAAIVDSSHILAEGIARKITKEICDDFATLNKQRWEKVVKGATQNAFMEVTDGGPLVKVGKNRSFVAAVIECTAFLVAAPGSIWANEIAARAERGQRNELKRIGLPPHQIEEAMQRWRAHHKT